MRALAPRRASIAWRPSPPACCACRPSSGRRPLKFVSEQCDPQLPGGAPPSANFVGTPGGPLTPFQNCASPGGAIGITETGSTSNDYAYWLVTVPATPGGYIESLAISAHVCGLGAANDHALVYETGLADELRSRHPATLPRPRHADGVRRGRGVLDPDELRRQRRALQRRADDRRPRPGGHPGRPDAADAGGRPGLAAGGRGASRPSEPPRRGGRRRRRGQPDRAVRERAPGRPAGGRQL